MEEVKNKELESVEDTKLEENVSSDTEFVSEIQTTFNDSSIEDLIDEEGCVENVSDEN